MRNSATYCMHVNRKDFLGVLMIAITEKDIPRIAEKVRGNAIESRHNNANLV